MPTRRAADASPTCHRRVSDASPSHRQRLALGAPLLSLSSKSSHQKRLVERRRRRVADASATRRRRRSMRRQRPALHAPLLDLSSTSFPHLAIQPTRRIARQRNADVSLTCRKRVADAPTTRRVADAKPRCNVADATPMRHRRDAHASPTPCLTRLHCLPLPQHHFLASPYNQRDVSRATRRIADASPIRNRIADATPMRRPRVTNASPTPCLARHIDWHVFNIIFSPRHPLNATRRASTRAPRR